MLRTPWSTISDGQANIQEDAESLFPLGIPIPERPWFALTDSQKELRLDTVTWSEGHDIFLHELREHPVKRVRSCASVDQPGNHEADDPRLQARSGFGAGATRHADQYAGGRLGDLATSTAVLHTGAEIEGRAAGRGARRSEKGRHQGRTREKTEIRADYSPALGGTFPSLDKLLDAVVEKAMEPGRKFKERKPPPWAAAPEPMPWADEDTCTAGGGVASSQPVGHLLNARSDPKFDARRRAKGAAVNARENPTGEIPQSAKDAETEGAIPEPDEQPENDSSGSGDYENPSKANLAEIELIREKLVVNGKVRLDLEALAVYLMCPSYFAIATGLDPEPWQSRFLDSYAQRLGCLASRQCGKSSSPPARPVCFAMTNPGTTVLVLAPTLRQSSELLLKVGGVTQIAGLKIASWSQFQIVLADKQPGAASRVVCLPGSNEDSGASTRGYAADMLILEEAAFLNDAVISSVLPSIAARPKAQLIGISSAGIIGTYFHSVMTSPQSRWTKMIVPAAESGRFTRQQLEELKLTLGARYAVEMECQWGSVGDSIYTEDVMTAAFGTDFTDPAVAPELDPEAAFGHLNLEEIFAAQPFPQRRVA